MIELKIGDIIQPTTLKRRKELGKGIIVADKQAQRYPIMVVFPKADEPFVIWDFTEGHLELVPYNDEERKEIVDAAYNFRSMQFDIKHA